MGARFPPPDACGGRAFLVNEARDAGVGRSRLAGSDLDKPFWGIRAPVASGGDLEALCAALTRRMPPHAPAPVASLTDTLAPRVTGRCPRESHGVGASPQEKAKAPPRNAVIGLAYSKCPMTSSVLAPAGCAW